MRRASITLTDDLDAAVRAFIDSQSAPPSLTTIVQEAVRAYLAERGYPTEPRRLHLTPSTTGSGLTDVSVEHDRELAET
jgi:hypothetical protein